MRTHGCGLFMLIVYLVCVVHRTNGIEELPAHKPVEEDCRKVRRNLINQRSAILCKPRMTLVKLQTEPEHIYYPNVVSVNRCHGFCQSHVSCGPIAKNYTTVYVNRHNINSMSLTCHKVLVEEHTACRCRCNLSAEKCNENQRYVHDECKCECTNLDKKRECNLKPNSRWNPETCTCICDKTEDECSTDLQWIPRYCKCLRVMDGDTVMN